MGAGGACCAGAFSYLRLADPRQLSQPLGMAVGATKLLFKRDVQMFFVRLPIITAGLLLAGLPGLVAARALTGTIAIGVNMAFMAALPLEKNWSYVRTWFSYLVRTY